VSVRPIKELRRTADLVFPKAKVAVFLDGCFWHGCPEHHTVAVTNAQFWADKVTSNVTRDRDTDQRLEEAGWVSLRIWEHEDPREAALRVRDVVVACRRR
jgi:DNA mismatch endonuclease (patch repair protein)